MTATDRVEWVPAHTVPQYANLFRERDRLRAIIRDAPHDVDCAVGTMMNVEEFYPCSCWKADAL